MMTLTAVCREEGYPDILIYTVKVHNPDDKDEVQRAVQWERQRDLGDEEEGGAVANEMEIFFAFQGDLAPRVDWR